MIQVTRISALYNPVDYRFPSVFAFNNIPSFGGHFSFQRYVGNIPVNAAIVPHTRSSVGTSLTWIAGRTYFHMHYATCRIRTTYIP
jgi:hypothetical protein